MNGAGCLKPSRCIVVAKGVQVYMIHSLQRVPSHSRGSAHVALLSSLGYSNESNCVFALVRIVHLLLHLPPAQRRAGASRLLPHAKLPPQSPTKTLKRKRDARLTGRQKYLNVDDFTVVVMLLLLLLLLPSALR